MKRFFLAIIIFSVWYAIAGTYYTYVIKGVDSDIMVVDNHENTGIQEAVSVVKEEELVIPKEDSITDSIKIEKLDSLKAGRLVIRDSQYLIKKYYVNFKIFKNSNRVQIPFGLSEYGFLIAKHMDSINAQLTVKGFYNQQENEQVGKNRALFLKEKLVKLGILDSLIAIKSVPAIFDFTDNKFAGGIDFNFKRLNKPFKITSINYESIPKQVLKSSTEQPVISTPTVEIENTAPEEEIKEQTIAEPKKEEVTTNETKEVEKKSFTVSAKDFRNNKFKPGRSFKAFFEDNKSATNLTLLGFSNAEENSAKNYDKGIELSSLVSKYIKKKALFSGAIKTNALKKQKVDANSPLREGVTLIIQ